MELKEKANTNSSSDSGYALLNSGFGNGTKQLGAFAGAKLQKLEGNGAI